MAKSNILGNVLRGVGAGWIRHQDERKKKRTEQEKYERDNKRSLEKEQRQTERQVTGEKRRNEMAIEGENRKRENAVKWDDIDYKKKQGRSAKDRERVLAEINALAKPSKEVESAMLSGKPMVAYGLAKSAADQAWIKRVVAIKDDWHRANRPYGSRRTSNTNNNTNPNTNQPTYDRQAIRYLSDDIDDLYRQRKNLRVDKNEFGEEAPTKAQIAKRKRIDNEIATSETRLRQLRRGNSTAQPNQAAPSGDKWDRLDKALDMTVRGPATTSEDPKTSMLNTLFQALSSGGAPPTQPNQTPQELPRQQSTNLPSRGIYKGDEVPVRYEDKPSWLSEVLGTAKKAYGDLLFPDIGDIRIKKDKRYGAY